METSLHRQLKELYATGSALTEVTLGNYRIDVVDGDLLVEVQHGSLAAIRDKVRDLLDDHDVLVVKPIVATKRLVKLSKKGGRVVGERMSPKRGSILDLFDELVYFTRVFPHPRLTLEAVLVDVEEIRYPGHGRRRRRRENDFQVDDQRLARLHGRERFRTATDLCRLLPGDLPPVFHTGQLAEAMEIERGIAQRIAYCCRKTGAMCEVGKQGNTLLYERADRQSAAA